MIITQTSPTVVREKYTVQNIHFKIIDHKKFSSLLVIDEKFYGWIFNACIKLFLPWFQLDNCGAIFDNMEVCERNSCVRGYHIYKDIWDAVIGEELQCEREPDNRSDRYAVAIKKDGIIIGHIPRKISQACSLLPWCHVFLNTCTRGYCNISLTNYSLWKYFMLFIFIDLRRRQKFLTVNYSRTTVY